MNYFLVFNALLKLNNAALTTTAEFKASDNAWIYSLRTIKRIKTSLLKSNKLRRFVCYSKVLILNRYFKIMKFPF